MEIYLSRHAKNRMWRFKIKPEEVLATVREPDRVTDSIKGRKNAWKKRTGDWLRVTYTVVENVNIVVTVTVKRKFSKEGDGSEN